MTSSTKKIIKRISKTLALAFVLGAAGFLAFNSNRPYKSESLNFSTMSTWATVWLYSYGKEELADDFKIVTGAFDDITRACNIYDPSSELARLNATAHQAPFKCSELLWNILTEARRFYSLSDGKFDVTITPFSELWKRKAAEKELPSQAEIDEAAKKVGLDKVIFNDDEMTVSFPVEGMKIDLGGIAKGAALDLAKERLATKGVNRGYIDLGGNVLTLPKPPPKKDFYTVQIKDPFNRDESCGVGKMLNEAVSTSGNYERYVTIDGRHYTHIIDPTTGTPVENKLSVTVITERAIDADALSTAIFAGGKDLALKLAKKFPDMRILIFERNPNTPSKIDSFEIGEWQYITPSEK